MITVRVFDAAGPTADIFHETGPLTPLGQTATRLAFRARILEGPHAGKTSHIEVVGINLTSPAGLVSLMRERVDNEVHFEMRVDPPVFLAELFDPAAPARSMTIIGNRFANVLEGDDEPDVIRGGAGNDVLRGLLGDDRLFGEAGNDRLVGGPGNDLLHGGSGADRMFGGPGNDIYVVDNPGDQVIEAANQGTDLVRSTISFTLPEHVEHLTLLGQADIDGTGNALANVIRGNSGDNVLRGGAGNDRLIGGAGQDVLIGGPGNDTLNGHDQEIDRLIGGRGNDRYIEFAGNQGNDIIIERPGEGHDIVLSFSQSFTLPANVEDLHMLGSYTNLVNATGNNLANTIRGTAGQDAISGLGGNDTLHGLGGNDLIFGGTGRDFLLGGAGNDQLFGGPGNDVLSGGPGADWLDGGPGRDVLTGGSGPDRFVIGRPEDSRPGLANRDVIRDFVPGVDTIVLESIDADTTTPGNQAFRFIGPSAFSGAAGELRYVATAALGVISGDVTGNGFADFQIALIGGPALGAGDFLL